MNDVNTASAPTAEMERLSRLVGTWRVTGGATGTPLTDGAYAGFLADESDDRVRAAYPPTTYERLAEVKRRYDPDNLFRLNANIHRDD